MHEACILFTVRIEALDALSLYIIHSTNWGIQFVLWRIYRRRESNASIRTVKNMQISTKASIRNVKNIQALTIASIRNVKNIQATSI